jgi:hypothetical protein
MIGVAAPDRLARFQQQLTDWPSFNDQSKASPHASLSPQSIKHNPHTTPNTHRNWCPCLLVLLLLLWRIRIPLDRRKGVCGGRCVTGRLVWLNVKSGTPPSLDSLAYSYYFGSPLCRMLHAVAVNRLLPHDRSIDRSNLCCCAAGLYQRRTRWRAAAVDEGGCWRLRRWACSPCWRPRRRLRT